MFCIFLMNYYIIIFKKLNPFIFAIFNMIDMIVNGIDFTSQDLVADSRSLMKYLSKNLDETFIVYPNYTGGPGNSTLLVERHNKIEAHISFEAGKVFLLKAVYP